ncbi:MAG: 3-deoxy-7-phosphoheptulonate synthase, partial [Defluviitaleaceae bacterium]|nr:3-deoxy-7-phosphoheptulonate synthase [Defluviitaleaceae bacterium]
MEIIAKIPAPDIAKKQLPISAEMAAAKTARDAELRGIIRGGGRFLVVMGPCSAHCPDALGEYAARLVVLQGKVGDKILLVARVYTQKPRTLSRGYMGIFHSPNPENPPDLAAGIFAMRKIHLIALNHGMITADELLYPELYPYLDDVCSYFAIGARSVENQLHRFVASGLAAPVGMKNPISGSIAVMTNSIAAAHGAHRFLFRGDEVQSGGNPLAHGVLRGYRRGGRHMPNFSIDDLQNTRARFEAAGLPDCGVIVDASHSNSLGDYTIQQDVAMEIIKYRENPDLRRFV